LILDDVIEDMNFPNKYWVSLPKSRAAKVNEFYTNPFPQVIFSAFLVNYGRKPKQTGKPIVHLCAIFAATGQFPKMLSLNRKGRI